MNLILLNLDSCFLNMVIDLNTQVYFIYALLGCVSSHGESAMQPSRLLFHRHSGDVVLP